MHLQITTINTVGQLCFRGPTVMKGYLKREEADIIDKDGFLLTGDLGSIDDKGRIHVTGRIKELIKVNGMQVDFCYFYVPSNNLFRFHRSRLRMFFFFIQKLRIVL